MKIGIDARELEGHRTGAGRYLDELLRAWTATPAARSHEFVLFTTSPVDVGAYSGLTLTVVTSTGHGVTWEQLTLRRLLATHGVDLLFAPGYTAPLRSPVPVVLVVHDVSFFAHPEWFSWREGVRRRTITRLAARRAAAVVTISSFSQREIAAYLDVAPSRISVIRPGLTPMVAGDPQPAAEPTILFVGSVFNRRHVPVLIEAVARLGRHVRLEVVGDNRTRPRLDLARIAAQAGVGDRMRFRSYVPEQELAECYARAHVFAFLSEYEGFGLTPLEALSAGVPIVVLDGQTTREVYGDAATFAPTLSPVDVAAALERALFEPAERSRVLSAAAKVLPRYSWTSAASQLLALFDSAAGGRARRRDII